MRILAKEMIWSNFCNAGNTLAKTGILYGVYAYGSRKASTGPPIVHHHDYSCPWPSSHQFKMIKFRKVMQFLIDDNVITPNQVFTPTEADVNLVTNVHNIDYVHNFFTGKIPEKEMRKTGFQWTEGVVQRCRLEVGGTLLSAHLAMEHGIACNTGGGTHHAFPNRGSGYCMLNDLAIVAQEFLNKKIADKVLIVDLDVHQGDGTAFIFENEPNVFTFSVHCGSNFPLRKQRSDFDVSLEDHVGDKDYLKSIDTYLPWIMDTYRPDLILYDAGIDPHEKDVLGRLKLTDQGLFDRDVMVLTMAQQRGIPCATVIGGGYCKDMDVLGRRHTIIHRAATKVWNDAR